jgi:hypothetical protein
MNKITMASTVPEMLDGSDVVQNKDGKLVEWEDIFYGTFSCGPTRSQWVTPNT